MVTYDGLRQSPIEPLVHAVSPRLARSNQVAVDAENGAEDGAWEVELVIAGEISLTAAKQRIGEVLAVVSESSSESVPGRPGGPAQKAEQCRG